MKSKHKLLAAGYLAEEKSAPAKALTTPSSKKRGAEWRTGTTPESKRDAFDLLKQDMVWINEGDKKFDVVESVFRLPLS